MRSPRLLASVLLAALVATSSISPVVEAAAPNTVHELVERLSSSDFRVRVQAALILGKTAEPEALPALLRGLKDESASVRAASAAALATYGDPAALEALRGCQSDENAAVVRQVKNTISSLTERQKAERVERQKASVLVKLGGMKNRGKGSPESVGVASQASRGALGRLSGVALLHPTEDPEKAAKKHGRPVVVVMGSIRELDSQKVGSEFVVSANVEFLMQAAPEFSIVGKLSGRAKASGDLASTGDALGRTKVQDAALGAAVESALGKSRDALIAAGRSG